MSPVKRMVGALVRRAAPRTVRNLETIEETRVQLDAVLGELRGLHDRIETVERRLELVEDAPVAVDELRRDSLRIAELTDLVMTRLGDARRRD